MWLETRQFKSILVYKWENKKPWVSAFLSLSMEASWVFAGCVVLMLGRMFPLALAWWLSSVSSNCQGHTEASENKSIDLTEMPYYKKKIKNKPWPLCSWKDETKKDELTCKLQKTRGKTNSCKPFKSRGKRGGNKECETDSSSEGTKCNFSSSLFQKWTEHIYCTVQMTETGMEWCHQDKIMKAFSCNKH